MTHVTIAPHVSVRNIHQSAWKVNSQKFVCFRCTRKLIMTGCNLAHSQWFIRSSDQGMRKGRKETKRAGRHRP